MPNDRSVNTWRARASNWFPSLQSLRFYRWTLYSIHVRLHDERPRFKTAPPQFKVTDDLQGLPWSGYTPLFLAYRFGPKDNDVCLAPDPRALPILRGFSNALLHRYTREVTRGQPKLKAMKYKNSTVE